MIDITVQKDRITVSGHAEYAEHGKDIVCAAYIDSDEYEEWLDYLATGRNQKSRE